MFVINVKGSIITVEGNHYARGWAAKGIREKRLRSFKTSNIDDIFNIENDVILNNTVKAAPYALYASQGSTGVSRKGGQLIACGKGNDASIYVLADNLNQ